MDQTSHFDDESEYSWDLYEAPTCVSVPGVLSVQPHHSDQTGSGEEVQPVDASKPRL
jgi:hypothetical protein